MNIFDLIRFLFFKVKNSPKEVTEEMSQCFMPYMINRWLSFYDRSQAVLVNETLNKFSNVLGDKSKMYKLYDNIIPRLSYKKITYVKKVKQEKDKENEIENIAMIASNKNISEREVKQYVEFYNTYCK
jgi:hypothetical protein